MNAKPRHPGASAKTPDEQMQRRRGQGVSYRTIASEHGVSKSTAHRRVKGDALRQGFNRIGDAK